jgi:hypothetical protein
MDAAAPASILIFMGAVFLLTGGWALFRRRPPKRWPRGGGFRRVQ